jgi:hypothetical protein
VRLLFFERYFNTAENINLTVAGQIGDFVGGLTGTFFSLVGVLLLFENLALQRKEFTESRHVFEKQQFETTFFNLIKLYQEVVKSLHFDFSDSFSQRVFIGKEFFEQQRIRFYSDFVIQENFEKSLKQAKIKYVENYISTKDQTSNYFRTLYRIFRYISNSEFSEEEKMHYAKIVRAQLSESELFFIYYNAYTEYGAKFRDLINEFNILKHLPYLEKVEYKEYAVELKQMEKNSVGLALEDLSNLIKKTLKTGKSSLKNYLDGAVEFKVMPESNFSFSVQITKKDDFILTPNHIKGQGLTNFNIEKTENLIINYLKDLFLYSNYFKLNGRHIVINSTISSNEANNRHKITISVSNKKFSIIKFN